MENWKDRLLRLLKAVEIERATEEAYYRRLSASKSIKERVDAGIAWYPVAINRQHYTVGENVELELVPSTPTASTQTHGFKVGASAILFIQKAERIELRGSISYLSRKKMRLILATDVIVKDHLLDGGTIGVELIFDDRPYRVMMDTLREVMRTDDPAIRDLRGAVHDQAIAINLSANPPGIPTVDFLNASQQNAVNLMHSVKRIGIIHGPPGTGKTTTLVGLILGLSTYEKRILVAAPSNNAVDLLANLLHQTGLKVLRIGNVTRMGDAITELSLDEQVRNHPDWQRIKQIKIEAENAHREAGKFKRKFGSEERRNRGLMYKEARELKNWARDLENRLVEQVINGCQVVCATLVGCASEQISDLTFATAVIDEGSQALEPESWIAIKLAQRVIIAGDHMQLPPTVKSKQAEQLRLTETLLDRMAGHIDESAMLTTQYRMHPAILGFSNERFYQGKLQTDASVLARPQTTLIKHPVVLIDTSGCGFNENYNPETRSRSNHQEFLILREHLLSILSEVKGYSIGIISPYREQVRLIAQEVEEDEVLNKLDLEINSIDGFQGQEKDVIYLSMVRSNDQGELGFLKDFRRLNVALTRARYKLIIVGDWATLGSDPTYSALAAHVENHGLYQSAWEYMQSNNY